MALEHEIEIISPGKLLGILSRMANDTAPFSQYKDHKLRFEGEYIVQHNGALLEGSYLPQDYKGNHHLEISCSRVFGQNCFELNADGYVANLNNRLDGKGILSRVEPEGLYLGIQERSGNLRGDSEQRIAHMLLTKGNLTVKDNGLLVYEARI